MKEKNLTLFEVEKIEELNDSDQKIIFVTLSLVRDPRIKIHDLFWIANVHISKLENFFESIGKRNPGQAFWLNWNGVVGRRGICELTKDGLMVKRYVYFPEIIDLIQKKD